MNFGEGDYVMTNTPDMLRTMGRMMTELGIKPEIEAFDTGHLWFAKQLVKEGIIEGPALVQLCMGIPWGAPNDLNTYMAMVNNIPSDWHWSSFSISRDQMPLQMRVPKFGFSSRVSRATENINVNKLEKVKKIDIENLKKLGIIKKSTKKMIRKIIEIMAL